MANIFISYSHHDEEFAKILESTLLDTGADVFLSGSRLEGGDLWEEKIWDNLEEADFFLFLASSHSITSDYPKFELGGAFYGEKEIIPILINIEPNKLPSIIQKYTALDFRNLSPDEVKKKIAQTGNKILWGEIKSAAKFVLMIFGGGMVLKISNTNANKKKN